MKKNPLSFLTLLIVVFICFFGCSSQRKAIKQGNKVRLTLVDSVANSSRVVSVSALAIQNKNFVYTVGENKTMEIYAVNGKGKLTFLNQKQITNRNGGLRALTHIKVDNKNFLVLGNKADNALEAYDIDNDGGVKKTGSVFDTDTTFIDEVVTIHKVKIKDKVFLYAGGLDKGMSVFKFTDKGKLQHIQSIKDNDRLSLHGIIGMSSFSDQQKPILVTGAFFDGSISTFHIAKEGYLKTISTVEDNDSLFLNGAFPVTSITLGDSNFLLVGHRHNIHYNSEKDKALYHGDGINVFKVNTKGIPKIHSLLKDNEDYSLKGSTRIETIKLNNEKALVFIGTRDDKGIQVCSLGRDGVLRPVSKIDLGFSVYNGMSVQKINDVWYLYVGAYDRNMLKVYRVDF